MYSFNNENLRRLRASKKDTTSYREEQAQHASVLPLQHGANKNGVQRREGIGHFLVRLVNSRVLTTDSVETVVEVVRNLDSEGSLDRLRKALQELRASD